jgi:hypothetical protein
LAEAGFCSFVGLSQFIAEFGDLPLEILNSAAILGGLALVIRIAALKIFKAKEKHIPTVLDAFADWTRVDGSKEAGHA